MLTLERVKTATQVISVGTKLFCYEGTKEFTEYEEYIVNNTDQYGYHVTSDNGNTIIFGTENALKSIFMTIE